MERKELNCLDYEDMKAVLALVNQESLIEAVLDLPDEAISRVWEYLTLNQLGS